MARSTVAEAIEQVHEGRTDMRALLGWFHLMIIRARDPGDGDESELIEVWWGQPSEMRPRAQFSREPSLAPRRISNRPTVM
jgi:hypothetical protein